MEKLDPRSVARAGIAIGILAVLGGSTLLVAVADGPATSDDRLAAAPASSDGAPVEPVNAVIGDRSFRATFGEAPDRATDGRLRLRTHLAYVEGLLRSRDVGHLSVEQRERRSALLDRLRGYWRRGVFPSNDYRPTRTPVFIDRQGRLCAVGHLIATSAGREAARGINERSQLELIREMDAPAVERWAERNGFTLRELAMIQPMYEPHEADTTHPVEWASMAVTGGAALLNGYLLGTDRPSALAAGGGVLTGGVSMLIGLPAGSGGSDYGAVHLALGGATFALGSWSFLDLVFGGGDDGDPEGASADEASEVTLLPGVRPGFVPMADGSGAPGLRLSWRF
jgi:hypothetical protein